MGLISNDMIIEDDLQIENNDIKIGNSDIYNIDYILKTYPGQFYHYPELGIGIPNEINSPEITDTPAKFTNTVNVKNKIKSGYRKDGYISDVQILNKKLYINQSKQENKFQNRKPEDIVYEETGLKKTIKSVERQTPLDIAIQEYGTLEYLPVVMSQNDIIYDQTLAGDTKLTVYPDDKGHSPFKEFIELNKYKPVNK